MSDGTKKTNDSNSFKMFINKIEIEIPEEKKDFIAQMSAFVLQVMVAAADGYNPEHFLSIGLHVSNLEAVQSILKRQEFECLVWEGAVNLFFKEFRSLSDGSYDPLAYLNLDFENEIMKYRNELAENYDIHVPKP